MGIGQVLESIEEKEDEKKSDSVESAEKSEQGEFDAQQTLIDMHDLGDALMQAGFKDPVLEVNYLTLRYRSKAEGLKLPSLRTFGSLEGTISWIHQLKGALSDENIQVTFHPYAK